VNVPPVCKIGSTHAAKSVNRSILKKSRHLGFGVLIVNSSNAGEAGVGHTDPEAAQAIVGQIRPKATQADIEQTRPKEAQADIGKTSPEEKRQHRLL